MNVRTALESEAEARITLALNLARLRTAAGMTMRALCEASGVSPATICRIEAATHDTSLRVLSSLAAALNVTVAELFAPATRDGGTGR